MEITRSLELSELNWGTIPDLPSRLERLGVTIESCSIELSRYPDSITLDSLDEAAADVRDNGSPLGYSIRLNGTREGVKFRLGLRSCV